MTSDMIPAWTASDYRETSEPYEWLYQFKDNKFKLAQLIEKVRQSAGAVGVRNFLSIWNAYLCTVRSQKGIQNDNVTEFDGQEIELLCGEWFAGEYGISTLDFAGREITACAHPVLPIQRLVNIDTGVEKLKIAFRKGKNWRTIISDKRTLASASNIVGLADYGLAVNSENAKYLVRYLTDIENMNYDTIPEINSIGRLGWIENHGFSPYDIDNMVFDGEQSFKHIFESVKEKGEYEKWLDLVRDIRTNGITARIMLAASFASILIKPCGALPFFVHLWGGTGTGKTVGLMLAASVWADPSMGRYITTMNSTTVAQELMAEFCNSMPMIMDELQVSRDKSRIDEVIYKLSEGVNRGRGKKTGGLQQTGNWANCILTTGEHPLSNPNSGGGAVNRIIDIDCKDEPLFKDPVHVVSELKKNFGFAGRKFVEYLKDENTLNKVIELQRKLMTAFLDGDTTEKQAQSASIILTADILIERWIFKDDAVLTINDISQFLSTNADVSINERSLQYIYEYIAINSSKFKPNKFNGEYSGEAWGKIEAGYIYIIKTKFNDLMSESEYNATAFLKWAKRKGLLLCDSDRERTTKKARIGGMEKSVNCVVLSENWTPDSSEFTAIKNDTELPW